MNKKMKNEIIWVEKEVGGWVGGWVDEGLTIKASVWVSCGLRAT